MRHIRSAILLATTLASTISSLAIEPRIEPRHPIIYQAHEIKKPPVQPPFSESIQDRDLRLDLPKRSWNYRKWSRRWIPKSCLEEAELNKLAGSDFVVRDVWYEDCEAPWTICRHKNVEESWESIMTVGPHFSHHTGPPVHRTHD